MGKQLLPYLVATAMMASIGWADEWKKSFSVSGKADLRVNVSDGSIAVHAWDRNEIGASVVTQGWQIRPSEVRVTDHQGGDRVEIEVRTPRDFVSLSRHSVHVELFVPRELRTEIRSGDGRISLPRHRSLRAHSGYLRTAPGAAMGGSFPGTSFPLPTN